MASPAEAHTPRLLLSSRTGRERVFAFDLGGGGKEHKDLTFSRLQRSKRCPLGRHSNVPAKPNAHKHTVLHKSKRFHIKPRATRVFTKGIKCSLFVLCMKIKQNHILFLRIKTLAESSFCAQYLHKKTPIMNFVRL